MWVNSRQSPEVRRPKFSRREWPVSGVQRTYVDAAIATRKSPKQTRKNQSNREPRKPERMSAVQRIEPALSTLFRLSPWRKADVRWRTRRRSADEVRGGRRQTNRYSQKWASRHRSSVPANEERRQSLHRVRGPFSPTPISKRTFGRSARICSAVTFARRFDWK